MTSINLRIYGYHFQTDRIVSHSQVIYEKVTYM